MGGKRAVSSKSMVAPISGAPQAAWRSEVRAEADSNRAGDAVAAALEGLQVFFFGGFGKRSSGGKSLWHACCGLRASYHITPVVDKDEIEAYRGCSYYLKECVSWSARSGAGKGKVVWRLHGVEPPPTEMPEVPLVPLGRTGHVFVSLGSQCFLLFGGQNKQERNSPMLGGALVYSVGARRWSKVDPRGGPGPRVGATAVAYDGKVVLFGGRLPDGSISSDVFLFDSASQSWMGKVRVQDEGIEPPPLAHHTADVIGDTMYVFGGHRPTADGSAMFCSAEIYTLNLRTMVWRLQAVVGYSPSGRARHASTVMGGRLLVYGGSSVGAHGVHNLLGDLYAFDPQVGSWTPLRPSGTPPLPRDDCCMFSPKRDLVVVLGGWIGTYSESDMRVQPWTDTIHVLNTEDNRWNTLPGSFFGVPNFGAKLAVYEDGTGPVYGTAGRQVIVPLDLAPSSVKAMPHLVKISAARSAGAPEPLQDIRVDDDEDGYGAMLDGEVVDFDENADADGGDGARAEASARLLGLFHLPEDGGVASDLAADRRTIVSLVDAGADVEVRDKAGRTPLQRAVLTLAGSEAITALLDQGANPNTADERGLTVLMSAVELGDEDVIRLLVQRGAKVGDAIGRAPEPVARVMLEAERAMLVERELGLWLTAEVDALSPVSETAEQVSGTPPSVLKIVTSRPEGATAEECGAALAAGAAVSEADASGRTALTYALAAGNLEVARVLVRKDATVLQRDVDAARDARAHSAELLALLDASQRVRDMMIMVPTVRAGVVDNHQVLVSAGADVNVVDPQGRPLLLRALEILPLSQAPVAARSLLALGADPDARDASGSTSLMRAADLDDLVSARLLLEAHCDPRLRTPQGHTALDLSVDREAFAQLLAEFSSQESLQAEASATRRFDRRYTFGTGFKLSTVMAPQRQQPPEEQPAQPPQPAKKAAADLPRSRSAGGVYFSDERAAPPSPQPPSRSKTAAAPLSGNRRRRLNPSQSQQDQLHLQRETISQHQQSLRGRRDLQVMVVAWEAYPDLIRAIAAEQSAVPASAGSSQGLLQHRLQTQQFRLPGQLHGSARSGYSVSFVSPRVGAYAVQVLWGDSSLLRNARPHKVVIEPGHISPLHCEVAGSGTQLATAGCPSNFTVTANDEFGNRIVRGGNRVSSWLTGPEPVFCDVEDLEDGTYSLSYSLEKKGHYRLHVEIEGSKVTGPGLELYGAPGPTKSSECRVGLSGPQFCRAGSRGSFVITAYDVFSNKRENGGDAVTCIGTGPEPLACEIGDNGDGTYTFSYLGRRVGSYEIRVRAEGSFLRRDRCYVIVEPGEPAASQSYLCLKPGKTPGVTADATGDVLLGSGEVLSCEAGVEAEIYLRSMDLCANCTRAGGAKVRGQLVAVVAQEAAGPVRRRGSTAHHSQVLGLGGGTSTSGTGGGFGRALSVASSDDHAAGGDALGSLSSTQNVRLLTAIPPALPVACEVDDLGDGVYRLRWKLEVATMYRLEVTLNDERVPNTPTLTVRHSRTDAAFCQVFGEGLRGCHVGLTSEFRVRTFDRFANIVTTRSDVVATVQGPELVEAEVEYDGLGGYTCSYVATAVGQYFIQVRVNGEPLTFLGRVSVTAGLPNASHSKLEGAGLVRARCGDDAMFALQLFDAYGNPVYDESAEPVTATVKGPAVLPVRCTYQGQGVYHFVYRGEKAGSYRIIVKLGNSFVNSQPIRVEVAPGTAHAEKCRLAAYPASNPLVATAGFPYDLILVPVDRFGNPRTDERGNAAEGKVKAFLVAAATGESLEFSVKDRPEDGTIHLYVTPKIVGGYKLDLRVHGEPVNTEALIPSVVTVRPGKALAERCEVTGPGLEGAVAGQRHTFELVVRDIFGNAAIGTSSASVKATVLLLPALPSPQGPLAIHVVGTGSMPNMSTLAVAGFPPGAPSPVRPVASASSTGSASGGGGFAARPSQPQEQPQRQQQQQKQPPTAPASPTPPPVEVPCSVHHDRDNVFAISYVVETAGPFGFSVLVNDLPVPGCDTIVATCRPAETHPGHTLVSGEGLTKAVAGVPAPILLTLRDKYGNRRTTGGDAVRISCTDIVNVKDQVRVTDNLDGTMLVSYSVLRSGRKELSVFVNDVSLPGFPVVVNVIPGKSEAGNTVAKGQGLLGGLISEQHVYRVHLKDALGNPCITGGERVEDVITGPGGVAVVPRIKDCLNGDYVVTWVAKRAGEYEIKHIVNGLPAGESCTAVVRGDEADISKCSIEGASRCNAGETGKLTVVVRDSTGAQKKHGGDKVRVDAKGLRCSVFDQSDGTYNIAYVAPEKAGNITLTVTINGLRLRETDPFVLEVL